MTGLSLDFSNLGPITLRLGAATGIGAAIGLNRHLRNHPAGLRTHAVVALGAATAMLISLSLTENSSDLAAAASRTMQGILTGIGFVGAGVVLHRNDAVGVHGLTSAASIWLVAILGIACGAGLVAPVLVATVLVFLVLLLGGPIEAVCLRLFKTPSGPHEEDGSSGV
jgi:putative Mg2+ transporter-C (MgtC) family protein